MQPNEVQRVVSHNAFTKASRWRTHFRLPTKLRLHSLTWGSLGSHSPFVHQTPGITSTCASCFFRKQVQGEKRALLEDITGEKKGVRMSALMKGMKVSLPSPAPSESARKRARRAAHTFLAHSTPWTLCVGTHYPLDPSRARRPPRSGFTKKVGENPAPTIAESYLHTTRSQISSTNSPHISELYPEPRSDIWGAPPKVLILSCFLSGCCLCTSILGCLHFLKGFCFLGLLRLLKPHSPAHFFVSIIQLSPVFSFDTFV